MEATLKFTLPEERQEFEMATNGPKYKAVLWQLDQYLRSQIKHADLSDAQAGTLELVRTELHEMLHSHQVTIDDY